MIFAVTAREERSENMSKAKEISALWSQIKPQIGELVRLCHEVESHAEVTADAYQRGYENGFIAGHLKAEKSGQSFYEDGYRCGLNDAWNAARTLWNTPNRKEIFGHTTFNTVLTTLTAQETIEKIRQYDHEKEERIQVGDEIEAVSGKAVVVYVDDVDEHKVRYVYSNGVYAFNYIDKVTKTGRHFPEIAEVFAKMKESDNG